MAKITLIVGGARSGKSSYALECAEKNYSHRTFIATATAIDDEMKKRIAVHQKERGDLYQTIEAEIQLLNAVKSAAENADILVVDCLTVWLGNLFFHCGDDEVAVKRMVDDFTASLPPPDCDIIFVSNEVGSGIVPDNDLARTYRDMCGYMNRKIAEKADTVYLCSCGIPIKIKE
jgi:adenosylcobinamide kinase/adenosylcobinamide-phosphate guanylyltransferase